VSTSIDALKIRRIMGRRMWSVPMPMGPDGWRLDSLWENGRMIVTCSDWDDDPTEWLHASMAFETRVPAYDELARMHRAVFGTGYAYQVFVGGRQHINIHANALHLWGRLDGKPCLPEFGQFGSI
jgi:hypothetical protein